jgi:intracellular multiplication protein IcmK
MYKPKIFLRYVLVVAALLALAPPAGAQEEPPPEVVERPNLRVPDLPTRRTSPTPVNDFLGIGTQSPAQPAQDLLPAGAAPPVYDAPSLSQEDMRAQLRGRAFEAAADGMLPLTPDEIRALLERYDAVQESVEVPYYGRPEPVVAVETASLDPGTAPLTIQVAQGHVTTVTFLDISGAPWPVEDISWAGNFEVVESGGDDGTHILRITPQSEFAYGNMSIRLTELQTPVILTLATARDKVHYRFDAIIPDYGPFATAPLIQARAGPTPGGKEISRVLEGVVPAHFARLNVTGVDGRTRAYRDGGTTYLRTPLTLLSPGWSAHVSSADGMRVYTLDGAPVLLLSDRGRMVRAYLSDRGEVGDE